MPEIAEIARIVHQIRQHLVGRTLRSVIAKDDAIVFGKTGTTAADFQKAMVGKRVTDVGQQGKYFWMIMSTPPHPLFHFGMSGWIYIRGEPRLHYRVKPMEAEEEWPPKYWKFTLETEGESKVEAAFTDARRFGRIRLLDCARENIRNTTPLKENGPDPVIDRDILSSEWLGEKLSHRHVPIKAFLLDQTNISGIGNWVGDEILYNSQIHPQEYCDTLSADQVIKLHKSIMHICQTAVAGLADSEKFPKDWLFKYRWGKGKKDAMTCLPNGAEISFITVGGRTSCIVPSIQKKPREKPSEKSSKENVSKMRKDKNGGRELKRPCLKSNINESEAVDKNRNRSVKRMKSDISDGSENSKCIQISQSYEKQKRSIPDSSFKNSRMVVSRSSRKRFKVAPDAETAHVGRTRSCKVLKKE